MNVDAVLFDAGNTLVGLDYRAISSICADHGLAATEDDLRDADRRIRGFVDRLVSGDASTEQSDVKVRIIERYLSEFAGSAETWPTGLVKALVESVSGLWTRPVDGAHGALDALHERGYRLAVVSNSDGTVESMLAELNLTDRLEFVVDSALVWVEKPDPAIFRIALDRLKVAPDRAVYVGDLPSVDVAGAEAAGLRAVLLDPGDNFPDCAAPRIRSLGELLDLLP